MDLSWLSYLWIIPVLGVLVFVHELGHFVVARLNGIRVDEFAIGFPPRLFGFKRNGVIYSVNLLPIGGFVRIYGENGEAEGEPDAFTSKKPWRRAAVLVAGPFMNVVLAFVMFGLVAMAGIPTPKGLVITDVAKNSPAAAAGLKSGDKLVGVAGTKIGLSENYTKAAQSLGDVTKSHLGKPTKVVVERNGKQIITSLTPRANPPKGQGAMGIVLTYDRTTPIRYPPLQAIGLGVEQTIGTIGAVFTGIGALISGLFVHNSQAAGGVAGPIGIAQITSKVAENTHLIGLMNLTALLSINLFIVNLFPLPALDGGRLVFVIIEAVRGKKVSPQREAVVHAIGMVMLLTVMVIISFFDVQRIWSGGSLLP